MNKTSLIVISIVVLLTIVSGAFYGGVVYGKSQNVQPSFAAGNFQGTRTNRVGVNEANFISGDIISKDKDSITLQIPNNGGSKIIFYSDTTQISKMATGTANDFAIGSSVSVNGTTNSDGSVTAQSVQMRPAGQDRLSSQNSDQQ